MVHLAIDQLAYAFWHKMQSQLSLPAYHRLWVVAMSFTDAILSQVRLGMNDLQTQQLVTFGSAGCDADMKRPTYLASQVENGKSMR